MGKKQTGPRLRTEGSLGPASVAEQSVTRSGAIGCE